MKLTDAQVRNLKPQGRRYEVWEDGRGGFGVRVTPRGTKSFIYLYRYEGKARRMTLGEYPQMSLADAHQAHAVAEKRLKEGYDPGAHLVIERKNERKAPTVADLVGEYLEKWAKPRKRSWAADKRMLDKDVLPEWGRRKAKDITRRDVIRLLDNIVDRGAPIIANRTLAVIRKMLNFAVTRDLIHASPCIGVQAPAPENRRDRVLSAEEIKAFWQDLDETRITEWIKVALKMLLVTAQRKGEVISAAWADIDLDGGWWTIPGEKTKNKLPHRVPISSLALGLLQTAKTMAGDSPWVFPSPRGPRHITGAAVDQALRLAMKSLEMEHFTPHDLRRSAATFMTGSCNIPRLVVSKILNHAEPHITAVYDRASYDKEKQMALQAWARKLQGIVKGVETTNVIPMLRGV